MRVLYMSYSRIALDKLDRGFMTRCEVEQIVLGCAMCYESNWMEARTLVKKEMFKEPKNKFLWKVLTEMKAAGMDVDEVSMFGYIMNTYPVRDINKLAVYICETISCVVFSDYDRVLSELLRLFGEDKRNGK